MTSARSPIWLEKYPSLNEDVSFHVYPNHHISISSRATGHKSLTWDAWQVFQRCNGTRTIGDLHRSLAAGWSIDTDELIDFMLDAETKGLLRLRNRSQPREIPRTGSDRVFLPQHVLLEVTTRCNLRCSYCYGNYGSLESQMMAMKDVERLFAQLSRQGVVVIEITGGEPAVHPNFVEILALAAESFPFVALLTNGVLISNEALRLIKSKRETISVQVSIDGSNESVNSLVRKTKGSFEKTVTTIQELLRIGVYLRVAFVLTPDNQHDLKATCELMRTLGVRNFSISVVDPLGRGTCISGPDGRAYGSTAGGCWKQVVDLLEKTNAEYEDMILSRERLMERYELDSRRLENCGAGWQTCVVDPSGTVRPCPLLPAAVASFGNIFEVDYELLFNHNDLSRFCQTFTVAPDRGECVDCAHTAHCGVCPVKVFTANKSRLEKGDCLCPVATRTQMDRAFDLESSLLYRVDV